MGATVPPRRAHFANWVVPAILCILAVAAALRAWGLAGRSLWFDEAYSIFLARQPVGEIIGLVRDYDTHPPLYYLLLHVWTALVGAQEAAVRLPSLLAGTGLVALTFLFGQRLAGAAVGLVAAALVALSPLQVEAARQVRMYPLLALLGLAASHTLWLALETGRTRHWIAYGVVLSLALHTHHLAWLLAIAHAVYVVGMSRKGSSSWIRTMGAVAIATLPLLPMIVAQAQTAALFPEVRGLPDAAGLTDPRGVLRVGEALFGLGTRVRWESTPTGLRVAILGSSAVLSVFGLRGLRRDRRRTFLLAVWLIPALPVALIPLRWAPSKWASSYDQYFAFLLPPLAIVLAAGGVAIAEALRKRKTATVALVALMTPLVWFDAAALADPGRRTTQIAWKGVAQSVAVEARADDFILVIPAYASMAFDYYFSGPQARPVLSPREMLAAHRDAGQGRLRLRTSVPPDLMAHVARDHPRLWIISGVSMGPTVARQFHEALAPHFEKVSEGRRSGIHVSLWESRLRKP